MMPDVSHNNFKIIDDVTMMPDDVIMMSDDVITHL